ncbi:MAG TPA: hypothetical protein EYP98_00625 [Planctomycetes bacterium]|nr:hypothetical protein [Planctomycetota bacterium]
MVHVTVKSMVLGFIAAAIAVVTVHELISYILLQAGMFPREPWSMNPAAVTGVPQIISDMFWGGVWGILFALIYPFIPTNSPTLKGLIFGIVAPAIMGVLIALPLLTGRFPLFFGFDAKLVGSVLLILAGFGAAMGWLYGVLSRNF